MRSSVNTSPLGWRSIRTVKLLNGAPPANVDRAAFIFHVPEVPSRPCPKQVAESSVDTSRTRMAHDAADRAEIQAIGGWRGVGNTAITLKTCSVRIIIAHSARHRTNAAGRRM